MPAQYKTAPADDNTQKIHDRVLDVVLVRKLVDAREFVGMDPERFAFAPADALTIRDRLLSLTDDELRAHARAVQVFDHRAPRETLAGRLEPFVEQGAVTLPPIVTEEAA